LLGGPLLALVWPGESISRWPGHQGRRSMRKRPRDQGEPRRVELGYLRKTVLARVRDRSMVLEKHRESQRRASTRGARIETLASHQSKPRRPLLRRWRDQWALLSRHAESDWAA